MLDPGAPVGVHVRSVLPLASRLIGSPTGHFVVKRATRESWFCGLRRSGRQDLNLRPPGPQPGALPDCATPRGYKRATGIEPALEAWKASVQPQHFAREAKPILPGLPPLGPGLPALRGRRSACGGSGVPCPAGAGNAPAGPRDSPEIRSVSPPP